MLRAGRRIGLVLVILGLIFGVCFAEVGKSKIINVELKKKISDCLTQRGYSNIAFVNGEEFPIENGYFFKVDGIDKGAKKDYSIEIVCTKDYATWVILMVKEKAPAQLITKK